MNAQAQNSKPSLPAVCRVREALKASRGALVIVGGFSLVVNLLMLTAPMYMLQIYDRVLSSRSEETLLALTVLAVGLLVCMGVLEVLRSRMLVRIGAHLDQRLNRPAFEALLKGRLSGAGTTPTQSLTDLDSLRQFLSGQGPLALFDAPWIPLYLALLYAMHPLLFAVSLGGALVLFTAALLNEILTRKPVLAAGQQNALARRYASSSLRNADVIDAMGMGKRLQDRWHQQHETGLATHVTAAERGGSISAVAKTLRMSLQIAILGVGAGLAIEQIITPGVMIAASIIMARALAPVDQSIAHWRSFVNARAAYQRLGELLAPLPIAQEHTQLPAPVGRLNVDGVFAGPPGSQLTVLQQVSLTLEPGEALGVIGPTASGKSTLARLLVGVWSPRIGSVRLDGAEIADWPSDERGKYIGYMPQDVELFAGSVAQNIARFEPDADSTDIVNAALQAGVHELILQLPDAYETDIGEGGAILSGGQRQRIGLARALYQQPALVVLDEPNANLDAEGDAALGQAIESLKAAGSTVVVMAHRPGAIAAVDKLLVLKQGRVELFGPKQAVLAQIAANSDAGHVRPVPSANRISPNATAEESNDG
ncbi:MAG: type I secretion system permease/ATPase [Pseudomonadota bacterium]